MRTYEWPHFGRALMAILASASLLLAAPARAEETSPQPAAGLERPAGKAASPAAAPAAPAAKAPAESPAAPAAKPSAESPAAPPVKAPEEPAAKPAGRGHIKPAAEAAAAPATAPAAPHALRFQFRFQPWKDVLDWFARQADLSLVMDAPPPGTFNYTDNHVYTPSEAIDLLNSVLLTKGFTLIRRGGMLMLVNLEDGIPPNLVPTVPLDSLDSRGEYELVRVPFNLEKLKPEEAEAEIKKLLGPQGSVVSLPKSRQVYITETGGRLRAIRTMLERIEGPSGVATAGLRTFDLKFARTEDVLPILRQLLDIPEDKNAAADGSIRVAVEAGAGRLILSGQPEKVARAADIIRGLDVPAPGAEGASRLAGTPQLEVYPAGSIDAQAALAVLQTLLAGQPDVRLSIDSKTNSLIAMARPAQHATIRATLAQLQGEGQRVEVIRLVRLDPQTVATAINKLFGGGDTPKPGAPQVEADAASRQLIVRGSESQIAQIRGLLEQMGEPVRSRSGPTQGGRVRTLPFGGSAARSALERIEEIWPTLRSNKIRVIGPSAVGEGEPGGKEPEGIPPELLNRLRDLRRSGEPPQDRAPPAGKPGSPEVPPPAEKPRAPLPAKATPTGERSAGLADGARLIFVADTSAAAPAKPAAPPPIIVIPGPSGLIIASEDTEALDEFEHLLDTMVDNSTSVRGVTVYYLKHAKAAAVADALVQIMGAASGSGGAASSAQAGPDPFGGFGGPFGAFGGPFGAFGGNMGGGFGGNQGGGRRGRGGQDSGGASDSAAATTSVAKPQTGQGGSLATGPVKITADQRLNALLVQANRTDLDSIEELLKILDQKESPEDIALAPKPRMIPVQYSSAEELAGVVKQVYADRMIEAAGSGQQGGGPFFMMQMAAARARQAGANSDVARMSVGVDARTNSLIVAAPDNLFEEVRQLVEQLDVAAGDQNQTVHVVTLHRSSPSAVEQALAAIAGSSVQVNHTVPQPGTGAATGFQPQFQGGDFQRRGQYGGGMGQGQGYGRAYNQPGQGYGRGMMNQPGQGYGRGMMNQPGQGYGRGMMNQPAGFNQPGQGQGYGRGMTNQTGGFNQPGQGGNQMGGQGGQRGGR